MYAWIEQGDSVETCRLFQPGLKHEGIQNDMLWQEHQLSSKNFSGFSRYNKYQALYKYSQGDMHFVSRMLSIQAL